MTEIFRFAILGLGAGALYGLAAIGLVLVYRGSGVVNFAQSAMGMVGAYVFYEARDQHHLPALLAVAFGLAASAALGAGFHLLVMRRMREASTLARIVATLALLVVLQSAAVLAYGDLPKLVASMLPIEPVGIFGAQIGQDRIYIFCIVIALTAVLWMIYKFTKFGVATTAVAENPRAAAAVAVSPNLIGALNWAVGSALGGLAAILLVPITGLGSANLTLLVIPVLAAAVVGRFSSFPLTTLAGLIIGVAQSEITRYVTVPGWGTAVPFILVAAVLIARGRAVAGKDERFGRMPALGTGRPAPGLILIGAMATLLCIWFIFPPTWLDALQIQMVIVIVLMSFIVVTGYAGQVSLAQMGFAGVGALVAGWFVSRGGWPFEIAILMGIAAAIPIGVIVGLAGVRTRGVNLAILTLGLAMSLESVVFGNPDYTGGILGYHTHNPTFFGIHVDGLSFPERYATLTLVLLIIVGLGIANLRRSRAGRRLIAVRTNERAAAALGISVVGAKLYAFVLGGMIAALGGILLAFRHPTLGFTDFAGLQSIISLQNGVLGGVGTLGGPLVASGFEEGTVGQQIFSFLGSNVALYLALASGIGLMFMLTMAPDGLAIHMQQQNARVLRAVRARLPQRQRVAKERREDDASVDFRVPPKVLELERVSVRFGGVVALSELSLRVGPGEVVGLIGPNGAGKSTTIEAITGFVGIATGTVSLGGVRVDQWSRERRARAGIGRSFQSLELFDDSTVLENIQTACDRRDVGAYLTNLVAPGIDDLTPIARAVIGDFGLGDVLDIRAEHLNYAERRMLAVARAVAGGHSILLLDEPASGLGEAQARRLGESIRRLAQQRGVGILLVEHNVDLVLRTCDRVHALDFGMQIGEGTPTELRSNEAVIGAYLGTARFHEDASADNEQTSQVP